MSEEVLINVTPQETRVAIIGAAWCRSCSSSAPRAAAWSATSTWGAWRACCPACSRRSSRSAWSAPRSCTSPTSGRQNASGDGEPIEKILAEGAAAAGAGAEGPDRHQGRAPLDPDLARRPPAGLPAAGSAHRHLAAHRGRERPRRLRERLRELLPPTRRAGSSSARWPRRVRSRAARRHRLPAQLWGASSASAPAPSRRRSLLYQDLSLAQRVLRDMVTETPRAC